MSIDARAWRERAKTFEYDEHRIFYWDQGQGPVLLLLHGFPTSSWDWAPVWEHLAQSWRVVTFDFLGYGFSDKPTSHTYTAKEQADIALALLDKLGVAEFTMLSHDYGDTVAQDLVLRDTTGDVPGTIHSWTMLNGGLFIEAAKLRPIQKLLLGTYTGPVVSALITKSRFEKSFSAIFAPDKRPTQAALDDFWWIICVNGGDKLYHKLIHYIRERRQRRDEWVDAMNDTSIPMQFVCGMLDPVSGSNMVSRYREVIHAPHIVELPNVGHYPQCEAPQCVLDAFEPFARRHLP